MRTVHTHILRCAIVGNLVVKGCQFRHFDKVTETLFLHDVVRHIELEIGRFLGEDCCPGIETPDVLPFQFFRTEIFEKQIEFCQ